METLWSGWRAAYVTSNAAPASGCLFCRVAGEESDPENLILLRGEENFVILNRFPYNPGHFMIVPYAHTSEFESLAASTTTELMSLLARCIGALKVGFRPDGVNVGMNLGSTAGAGIAEHVHLHVVPRWNGDTNFMPTVAGVKVIPELIEESYRKLAEALAVATG